MRFKEYNINDLTISWARREASRFGNCRNPNFLGGETRVRGIIAERVFGIEYPLARHVNVSSYDYRLSGYMIEIKSRATTHPPSMSYVVTLLSDEASRIDPKALLVFFAVSFDMRKAWMIGWKSLSEFIASATWRAAGTVTPFTVYRKNNYELRVSMLNEIL
jgi:hypothetical protein